MHQIPYRQNSRLIILSIPLILLLVVNFNANASDVIEKAGNILRYVLPSSAAGMTFINKDMEGTIQFAESAALTVGISPITITSASPPHSVLLFGGVFTTENMGRSLNPFTARHESNYITGGAYGQDFYAAPYGLVLGVEIGVANRYGMGKSMELWGGVNIRHSGLVISDFLRVIPGITVGFSAITKPVGTEAEEQRRHNGNAHILGYLSPELALALQRFPNVELVYRLQHRSGAFHTFGNMAEGANANVFGVRYRF